MSNDPGSGFLSLWGIVRVILYLIGACLIFALLFWLINYIAREVPSFAPFAGPVRVVLVVLIVVSVILAILSFITGKKIFKD